MTLLEILDSAVKIGLGALIAGYFTARQLDKSHRNERDKEARTYKREAVEKIAEKIDDFFRVHGRFQSRIRWIAHSNGGNALVVTDEDLKELKERDELLRDGREASQRAAMHLILLGQEEIADELRSTITKSIEMRNAIFVGRQIPSSAAQETYAEERRLEKKSIESKLATLFSKLI